MTTTQEVLTTAAEMLADPHSWNQGGFSNDYLTAFCAIGIIRQAYECHGLPMSHSRIASTPAHALIEGVVKEQYDRPFGDLTERANYRLAYWNDARERTHAEVVAVFEKARMIAAEKGI